MKIIRKFLASFKKDQVMKTFVQVSPLDFNLSDQFSSGSGSGKAHGLV